MTGGPLGLSTPTLWVTGCVVVLASPGLISFAIAHQDRMLHDTYFVVLHRQWVLTLAAVFGFFAGWYYSFPKISRYAYSDLLAKVHFWLSFIGFSTMLLPQVVILAGVAGEVSDAPEPFHYWNLVSSTGACVFAAGFVAFFVNMALSFLRRRPAG